MVKQLGTGAILWPKSGKYEWFTKLVLGTESLTGTVIVKHLPLWWTTSRTSGELL